MYWVIGTTANAVVAVAYLLIAGAILRPLLQTGQVRTNRLGTATAAIFFTCAVHHGGHSVHMLLPYLNGVGERQGLALRDAYDWPSATWDVVTAAVGIYYWTLRRTYGSLMRGAQLFDDMRQRERQALELNDNVLQGLVVAKLALELDDRSKAYDALEAAIGSASGMITELLGAQRTTPSQGLLRKQAADLKPDP